MALGKKSIQRAANAGSKTRTSVSRKEGDTVTQVQFMAGHNTSDSEEIVKKQKKSGSFVSLTNEMPDYLL